MQKAGWRASKDSRLTYEDYLKIEINFFKKKRHLLFLLETLLDELSFELHERLIHGEQFESNKICQMENVTQNVLAQ